MPFGSPSFSNGSGAHRPSKLQGCWIFVYPIFGQTWRNGNWTSQRDLPGRQLAMMPTWDAFVLQPSKSTLSASQQDWQKPSWQLSHVLIELEEWGRLIWGRLWSRSRLSAGLPRFGRHVQTSMNRPPGSLTSKLTRSADLIWETFASRHFSPLWLSCADLCSACNGKKCFVWLPWFGYGSNKDFF